MSYSEIVSAVRELPVAERLALMDDIWIMSADLDPASDIGAEHARIIDERLVEHEANPSDVLTWEQVFRNET